MAEVGDLGSIAHVWRWIVHLPFLGWAIVAVAVGVALPLLGGLLSSFRIRR